MNTPSERTIFSDALDLNDQAERQRFLDQACANDPTLRANVESLLRANDQTDHLIDQPPVKLPLVQSDKTRDRLIDTMIGRYRLREQIGEGGFGLVFVAQQEHPVHRKVALKIVKPGTGSKEVIARFEAERQAVAMMDHPNIAQVFDAGVSDDGRPYFVMELVRGVPITEFADAHRMTIHQRLELFTDVCAAVHHAHQKGIIHRDIKPSNVMVTLHDDKPVVKVIDFGVAKAIGQSLTDQTIYTRFFSMIGTPLYMSPEQAEMSGLDVDTRSDIYSLGVMLYELLAGATPFDRDRLDSAGLDEMRRIICEEDPPRPSRRLSTLGNRITTVSNSRRVQPQRLTHSLRGDVDWIAMKALEKNRTRRYDSAAAMASDIQRYLNQQPIDARPPSVAYHLLKFARRHRIKLATGTLVLMALLSGTVTSLWLMNRAIDERNQKEIALKKIEQFAGNVTRAHALVASGQAHADAEQWDSAVEDFDAAVLQQPDYYLPWVSRAQMFTRLERWDEAAADFATAIALDCPTDTPQWWGSAALLRLTGQTEAYNALLSKFETKLRSETSVQQWEMLRNGLADGESLTPDAYAAMATLAEQWLASTRHRPGERRPPPPPSRPGANEPPPPRRNFGNGPPSSAADHPGHDRFDRPPEGRSPPRAVCLYITGLAHLRAGNLDQAMVRLKESLQDDWPQSALAHAALAIVHQQKRQPDDAQAHLQRSQTANDKPHGELANSSAPKPPWFDTVELRLLQREAEANRVNRTGL